MWSCLGVADEPADERSQSRQGVVRFIAYFLLFVAFLSSFFHICKPSDHLLQTRRSPHSQKCKGKQWLWPLTVWPKNKSVFRTHRGTCKVWWFQLHRLLRNNYFTTQRYQNLKTSPLTVCCYIQWRHSMSAAVTCLANVSNSKKERNYTTNRMTQKRSVGR